MDTFPAVTKCLAYPERAVVNVSQPPPSFFLVQGYLWLCLWESLTMPQRQRLGDACRYHTMVWLHKAMSMQESHLLNHYRPRDRFIDTGTGKEVIRSGGQPL